ncbi:MAG: putative O-glycosylation ligase, exosortase A system-associated [Burkholderiales bacterium]
MRDILITLIVFGLLPFILRKPSYGIYAWSWISYMNPNRLAYGFAYSFPFAYIVAVTTLISALFSREPKRLPLTRETILLILLLLWMLVTTLFALHPALAWPQLEKVAKIQLMVLFTLVLINSREKVNLLIWTIVLSLGFYGIKGGIFTIVNGGVYHVTGPADSFIGGNNELALALVMTIPLMRYLQLHEPRKWLRWGLSAGMLLTVSSAIGSQSRGALLAIVAMGLMLWLKSRNKLATGILIVIAIGLVAAIMPPAWYARMGTIETYQQDESALGRINAWEMAFNLANDHPIVGGGFETFQPDTFAFYAPDPLDVHAAHSIYFQMLGEHGYVGLGLFLLLGMFAWRSASVVRKRVARDPDQKWLADLMAMLQVSMAGFAVGGLFLSLAYFDLYYNLIAFIIIGKALLPAVPGRLPAATFRNKPAPARPQ